MSVTFPVKEKQKYSIIITYVSYITKSAATLLRPDFPAEMSPLFFLSVESALYSRT